MLTALDCPTCGAQLAAPAQSGFVRCSYCGATVRFDPPAAPAPAEDDDEFSSELTWSNSRVLGFAAAPAPRIAYAGFDALRFVPLGGGAATSYPLVDDGADNACRIADRIFAQLEDGALAAFEWPSARRVASTPLPSPLQFPPIRDGDALRCACQDGKIRRIALAGFTVVDERGAGGSLKKLGFRARETLALEVTIGATTFGAMNDEQFAALGDWLPDGLVAAGDLVIAIANRGDDRSLFGVDAATGAVRWQTAACDDPFSLYLVDGVAFLHGDTDGTAMGVDPATGRVLLRTAGENRQARITLYGADGQETLVAPL